MSITHTKGATVFTGPDVDVFRILVLRGAMEVELRCPGLRVTRGRSVFARVKEEFGLRGSKASVYAQFCAMHTLTTYEERDALERQQKDESKKGAPDGSAT